MAKKKAEKVQPLVDNPALDILALNLFEKENNLTKEQFKECADRVEQILQQPDGTVLTQYQQILATKWCEDTTIDDASRMRVLGPERYNKWKEAFVDKVQKSPASENNSEAEATIELSGTGTMKVDTEEKKEENKMTNEEMQKIAVMAAEAMKKEDKEEKKEDAKKEQGFFDELCGTVKEATDTTVGKVALVAAGGAAAIVIKKKFFDEPADSDWASGETQIASQGASMFF